LVVQSKIKEGKGVNIFVANFDEEIREDDLEELFEKYGPVTNVTIWFNSRTNQSEG
jgi:RNA recognition motif-containing protein